MKKYILLFATTLLLGVQSCNDDYLDRFPETEITKEYFFNTAEDLEIYINGLYDFYDYENGNMFDVYIADRSTDNAATTGVTELKNMMIGAPTPTNVLGGWDWTQLRKINYFLDNFSKAEVDEPTKNNYEGLARFFRAKFYMQMVLRYSDVPWYDKVLATNDPDMYKGRDPRAMVVDLAFEDYAFAWEHVQDDSRIGPVDKWVVGAYYARHALYEGTYRKYHSELSLQASADGYLQIASEVAKDIMTNGGFSLYSTGKPMEDYGNLFISTDLGNNPEVIFSTLSQNNVLNSGWWGYMFGNYEASPSRDLLQAYLMTDGTPYTSQANYETKQFVEEFQDRDPRLSQTYAYPGWELINTSTYAQGAGIYVQQLTKNFSGYHQIKAFVNDIDVTIQNSTDVPLLRFAETLLTYAEAQAELGALTQEDLDLTVNKLRDRVAMPHLTLAPVSDPVLQAQYPNVSGAQADVLREIRRERRVELAMEGFRFDDLMRWHAAKLIEKEPEGLYFPGLGKYDLTGDGVEDIILISNSETIPSEDDKESNSLGKKLTYYQAGPAGSDASVYLSNGTSGTCVTDPERGQFLEPKYYYRPIPQPEVVLNPNLKQIFDW